MIKFSTVSALLCLASLQTAEAQPRLLQSPATVFFDAVSEALQDRYYPAPGLDLSATLKDAEIVLATRCAGLENACPETVGVEVVQSALGRLGDRHIRLYQVASGATAQPGPTSLGSPLGWIIRADRATNALYVSWVSPNGPAARAGVRRFDRVIPSAGETAADLNAHDKPIRVRLSRLDQSLEVDLKSGESLPPQPRLDWANDVAVLQLPRGVGDGVADAVHDLARQAHARNAKGLVLDLRDNGGGGVQCAAAAGAFLDYTAVMTERSGRRRLIAVDQTGVRVTEDGETETLAIARPFRWSGPLAILVNENTGSCAEAMAIQASLAGRARIFGEASVGVGNNVVQSVALPSGWRLQLTVAYGATPEGRPLPPRPPVDVSIEDDPLAISNTGHDTVLEAALGALPNL